MERYSFLVHLAGYMHTELQKAAYQFACRFLQTDFFAKVSRTRIPYLDCVTHNIMDVCGIRLCYYIMHHLPHIVAHHRACKVTQVVTHCKAYCSYYIQKRYLQLEPKSIIQLLQVCVLGRRDARVSRRREHLPIGTSTAHWLRRQQPLIPDWGQSLLTPPRDPRKLCRRLPRCGLRRRGLCAVSTTLCCSSGKQMYLSAGRQDPSCVSIAPRLCCTCGCHRRV